MTVLLLLSVLLSTYLITANQNKENIVIYNREAVVTALLYNAFLCWLYAEGASLFDVINSHTASIYWCTIVLVQTLLWFRIRNKVSFKNQVEHFVETTKNLSTNEKIISSFVVLFILLPLFIQAVIVPPNNYDSHYYHLHRILAWINYSNLDFFPTQHIQQLYHNVFAEYMVLNVYLLTGSDQFVNLIQYFAGTGTIIATTLLARQLGMNRQGQFLTAIILITLPIGIFEMTSTQVDYIATFFFISFLYFGFKLISGYSLYTLLAMAGSLGFAAFTKYPTLFYALPFCIYFGIQYLIKYRIKKSIWILSCILLCFAIIFTPFWQRNYSTFQNVLSPDESSVFLTEKLPAEKFGLRYSISGFLKNSSLHFGLPVAAYNTTIEDAIRQIHTLIRVDINEPGLFQDAFMVRYSVHEDTVPNTLHFYSIALLSLSLLFIRGSSRIKLFWILGLIGFVLFSSILKFQLWSTRTHLPFMAMGTLLIAFSLQSFNRTIRNLVVLLFLLSSQFYVFGNPNKPLLPLAYYGKKVMGHLPVNLCLPSSDRAKDFQPVAGSYYDFSIADDYGCYPLKSIPGYSERIKIINAFDQLGYYENIKKTIFEIPRDEAYFLSQKSRYVNYSPFFPYITENQPPIGLITNKGDGAYFYQAALKAATGSNATIDYIYFRKEFSTLKNYQKAFCYTYILSDDQELALGLIPNDQIDQLYQTQELVLIKLKSELCQKYEY